MASFVRADIRQLVERHVRQAWEAELDGRLCACELDQSDELAEIVSILPEADRMEFRAVLAEERFALLADLKRSPERARKFFGEAVEKRGGAMPQPQPLLIEHKASSSGWLAVVVILGIGLVLLL